MQCDVCRVMCDVNACASKAPCLVLPARLALQLPTYPYLLHAARNRGRTEAEEGRETTKDHERLMKRETDQERGISWERLMKRGRSRERLIKRG